MISIYDKPIDKNVAWGGDIHTQGRPVSGKRVEEFIKNSLNKRFGYVYEDLNKGKYLCFADEEDYQLYLETDNEELKLALIIQEYNIPGSVVKGPEPPENKGALWIDTTEDTPEYKNSILNSIAFLQLQVDTLMNIRTSGAISGNINDGTRTAIVRENPIQLIPNVLLEEYEENLRTLYEDGDITLEEYNQRLLELRNNTYDPEDGEKPDYPEGREPTVNHVSIKLGTWTDIRQNLNNLVQGELVYCTDKNRLYIIYNGETISISGGGGTSGEGSDEPGINDLDEMTQQQIEQLINDKFSSVSSIGFVPIGSDTAEYTGKVNEDGKFIVYDSKLDDWAPELNDKYYFLSVEKNAAKEGLLINSFYLGGEDNDEHSYQPCSHNFIELSNVLVNDSGEGIDINLKGFYLLYCKGGTDFWYELPLWGTIPAGGTFLIRGALCSVMDANTTKLKVKTCDMEWDINSFDSEGNSVKKPIKFSLEGAIFYICWKKNDEGTAKFYDLNNNLKENLSYTDIISYNNGAVNFARGYVDLFSFNDNRIAEKNTYTFPDRTSLSASDVIFRRWYMLDPVQLSNPKGGIGEHNNQEFMSTTFLNAANISDYSNIEEFTPKASFEGKTISTTRSLFLSNKPNTLTCTFGILATDDGNGATRGFCWNSVGYFDEYLLLRKKGESTWKKIESVKSELNNTSYINSLPEGISVPDCINSYYGEYVRKRWETAYGLSITTHKVLISGLRDTNPSSENGTVYEYKVVRDDGKSYLNGYEVNDENFTYESITREFTVRADSKVNSFNFVQTTDLLGANWEEYEVWNLSAKIIKKADETNLIPNYDFTINTGDICYNGSRSNEWIDYFRGYEEALSNKEEMLTIGNNDLAPISMRDIGNGKESPWKINVNVGDYFYCVEIDTRNPVFFSGEKTYTNSNGTTRTEIHTYKIPSLYSFNYGPYHFISLLSEIRTGSNKVEYDSDSGTWKDKAMKSGNTVDTIFGIDDNNRGNNSLATLIYDVVEGWIIKDLMLWKGHTPPNNIELDRDRYDSSIVGLCSNCIVFTHEMPFNITALSSYDYYLNNLPIPRETAKAYLNRHHNFEFLRVFKLWGIRMIMGGHKHTPALTYPVYDAPLGYNPITQRIQITKILDGLEEIVNSISEKDDILNDTFEGNENGIFSSLASFQPFIQVTPELFSDNWTQKWKNCCKEVYNNTSSSIIIDGSTVTSGEKLLNNISISPTIRIEIVDNINAPSYVMCHATGFKNVSNSDLAAENIPWEKFHTPGTELRLSGQLYPFFTVYQVNNSSEIDIQMYRIKNMYTPINEGLNAAPGYWDLNKIYDKSKTGSDTLEGNRQYYVDNCVLELYNNTAQEGETPTGTSINLV